MSSHRIAALISSVSLLAAGSIHGAVTDDFDIETSGKALALTELSVFDAEVFTGSFDPNGSTELELGGVPVMIRLHEHSIRSNQFKVLVQTDEGFEQVQPPAVTTVRGFVVGEPGSSVSGAIHEGRATLTISTSEGSWSVEPIVAPDGTLFHAIAADYDHVSDGSTCGVGSNSAPTALAPFGEDLHAPAVSIPVGEDDHAEVCMSECHHHGESDHSSHSEVEDVFPTVERPVLTAMDCLTTGPGQRRLELSIDMTRLNFRLLGGSLPTAISFIEAVVNDVSTVYERDTNTVVEIKTIVIRQSPATDPYGSENNSRTLLDIVGQEWETTLRAERGDLVHLFAGSDGPMFNNNNPSVAGQAWLNGLCTFQRYGVNAVLAQDTAIRRTQLLSHEMGHNLAAWHCNTDTAPTPANDNYAPDDCHIMCTSINGCQGPGLPNFGSGSVPIISNFIATKISCDCLDIIPECSADLNGSGSATVDDYTIFATAFGEMNLDIADRDATDVLDIFDFFFFFDEIEDCQ